MAKTEKPNLMAGMTFKLLGATLDAGITIDDKGTKRIFLHQDVSVPNKGLTVDELVEEIQALLGKDKASADQIDKDKISAKLSPLGKKPAGDGAKPTIDVGKVKFFLTTAYLDMKVSSDGDTDVEYAFRLDVEANGLIDPKIDVINIDRLTIAVWNTTREDVVKQLNLLETK